MTTTDKNRIIAQFMGLRPKLESPDVYSFSDSPWFVTRGSDPEKIMDDIASYSKYHSDWNWLHQAIDKIEGLLPDDSFVTIEYKDCYIPVLESENPFTIQTNAPTKIEAVHEAVYQFVVWHNQQVKENPKP